MATIETEFVDSVVYDLADVANGSLIDSELPGVDVSGSLSVSSGQLSGAGSIHLAYAPQAEVLALWDAVSAYDMLETLLPSSLDSYAALISAYGEAGLKNLLSAYAVSVKTLTVQWNVADLVSTGSRSLCYVNSPSFSTTLEFGTGFPGSGDWVCRYSISGSTYSNNPWPDSDLTLTLNGLDLVLGGLDLDLAADYSNRRTVQLYTEASDLTMVALEFQYSIQQPLSEPSVDTDLDTISDADEVTAGTDPLNPDTDYDGTWDAEDTNPLLIDPDSPLAENNLIPVGEAVIVPAEDLDPSEVTDTDLRNRLVSPGFEITNIWTLWTYSKRASRGANDHS